MKNAIIFIIALGVSNLALAESPAQIYGKYAAPFGLEWGMSAEQVTAMGVELTPRHPFNGAYNATILPKNLSDVKQYSLRFNQRFGLIKVVALIELDTLKGKERYNQVKTTLVNKYGKPSIDNDSPNRDETLHWGSDIDGTIELTLFIIDGVDYGDGRGLDGFVSFFLTYQSAAYHTALEQGEAEKFHSDKDAL